MPRLQPPTRGTRIAVWLFPALTLWLGLSYIAPVTGLPLIGGDYRLDSTAFDAARDVMPMARWGVVFVVVAVAKILCLLTDRERGYVIAMCAGMGLYGTWLVLFTVSLQDPHTSLGAPAWPLFVIGMHVAVLATMTDVVPLRRRKG